MINLMRWLTSPENSPQLFWAIAFGMVVVLIMATCVVPHDFGMYNNLKTICHIWEGRDGYRRQATIHINSSENIHSSHPWDYDGECEK